MKKQYIQDLNQPGMYVDGVFYLGEKEIRKTRDGKDYIRLQLRDKSGTMLAVFFDPGSAKSIPKASFVRVTGQVTEYKGQINIKIDDIWQEKEEHVDYTDFMPSTYRDVEECFARIQSIARSLREPMAALLTSFFDNASFARRFKLAPGGITVHHAYLGGLCIHTHDMLALAHDLVKKDKNIDSELLYAGILLHDIGKIREYQYTRCIDNSDEGKFLGHIAIGIRMVETEIGRIPGFPEPLAWKLIHMILSHHGPREYGSPVPPKFLEAQMLHQIDNLDAKRAIYHEMKETNNGNRWSEYNPYLGHDVFFNSEQ
ncbi:HD domain-containing protein [candidate division WOR-3 bacterium]|uniref:HD domain-containing protein n=1 Tax=candidate division WOR-3 bacterium TaxID=2052148 RepID=A0A9D5K8P8_UNCW3|nr:HD domain-containing protein [candidate division WOR-3 bacterium]MBD3364417.1 HD domain-containing protein [candidate division WOR-3 bacterium]